MQLERVGVELWDGAESLGYELTSDQVSVTIADLGAHVAGVVLRLDGNEELQISLGYPPGASTNSGRHGATIGRYANRIAGARFELDGESYILDANEGANHIHGGSEGFDTYAWSADGEIEGDTGRVVLRHKSKAGDMGYPGTVKATAVYELQGNELRIDYHARTTAPTPINLTNHLYWNLGDTGTLDDHELMVNAAHVVDVDDHNIPLAGPPLAVDDTRFDCRSGRPLSDIVAAGGYDHCFVLDPAADAKQVQASLRHGSGRRVDVLTNQTGVQAYTGQHLDPARRGIALETQHLPDTPNRPDFGDCILHPDERYHSSTTFRFSL